MKKKLSAAMMFMVVIAILSGCGQKSDEQKTDVQVQTQEEQVVSDNEAVTLPDLSESRPVAYPPCVMMDGEPEIFQNIEMESDGSIPPEVLHFNAEIKEIGDGNLLVTYISTADGFMELSKGDYVVSTDNLLDEVQEGDVVTIWFGGTILETAPAQLTNVYRIEKAE